jgi:hypothetical protein
MRRYYVTFPFKGEYHFITLTERQLANAVATNNIELPDFMCGNKEEDLDEIIHVKGEKYVVGFGYNDPATLNVYEYQNDGGGFVIERNIPYLLVKIEDDGKEIYNIGNDV